LAVAEGAAQRVQDADELIRVTQELLRDDVALSEMKARGQEFVANHQGATDKAIELIGRHLSV
jgi:3-deoxy-D-manno-octulosonic-acid transferase